MSHLLPQEHGDVYVTSIGYQPQLIDIPNADATIIQHYQEGGEELTLHALWNYCRSNPFHDTKVIYLYSKGPF